MSTLPDSPVRLGTLRSASTHGFELRPDAETCARIAQDLGLLGLRKLRFAGQLIPDGKTDWRLEAQLGATVTQPCVVTLEPVTTRIDVTVARLYVADLPEIADSEDEEVEMPEDESVEPLPEVLDLRAVMQEELALNLPLYPRADGAELAQSTYAEPGVEAMSDDDAKPFAGLAELRKRLETKGENDPD
ncbi:YceD family protein [Actibacterium sp. XHP0104]|uniref:YceD family protein n=1 Tax=Actibacterium sp. XHP0104 TaxID=2984335 RepID=UPI0021E8BE9E|nr:DUF177 domain-containing protein [Actibacterium sp. XHP0104]MCV2881198.1 DUF177 domain-containing protein [Actibacterium sp. XHP0104]